MRVILPDSTELELPDGASGLDAARATGRTRTRSGSCATRPRTYSPRRRGGSIRARRWRSGRRSRTASTTTSSSPSRSGGGIPGPLGGESRREIAGGRAWGGWEASRDEARRYFEEEGEQYK